MTRIVLRSISYQPGASATGLRSVLNLSSRLPDVMLQSVHNYLRCHYTKSNPIDDHSNISSNTLRKQNFKPLGHYTCMQCGTSHLQTVQEHTLLHIILATYRKFTVATVRFTQNVSCNIYKWQMSLCNNSSDNKSY